MIELQQVPPPDRTIIVHLRLTRLKQQPSLQEIKELTVSAGGEVVSELTASRPAPHPASYIGSGKLDELKALVKQLSADLVIFNHSISPIQERNVEREIGCRVLDRTGLILDIFSQRAASSEGKLQVELAQLKHLSTRLVRGWTHLERQKGGIGLRGPGETQLETDRRLIGQRIKNLNKKLKQVSSQRQLRRRSRNKVPLPTVSLVGYTNAGKSTLFNRLTGADVYAADQLFATLDPTMRRVDLAEYGTVVLSDTVGFIRDLPHTLVQAFQSTLEEVTSATLLLHVIDVDDPNRDQTMAEVDQVLCEIGASDVPTLLVYNKIDLTGQQSKTQLNSAGEVDRVWCSAQTGEGMDELTKAVVRQLGHKSLRLSFHIPVNAGAARTLLYQHAKVENEEVDDYGNWQITASLTQTLWQNLSRKREFAKVNLIKGGNKLHALDVA